jgi:protein-S-isoprenylcysteine O-methyltransferase Ste14
MKRILYLAYGILAYLVFLGTVVYAIGFFGNILVSKTMDGARSIPLWKAIIVNASLLVIFVKLYALFSIITFKKWWIRMVPEPLKRISFVLLVSMFVMFVMIFWQPMGVTIWRIESEVFQSLVMVLYLSGWMIVFASTFLINHFDLFGIRQVWFYYQRWEYESLLFRLPIFYKIVRHPLYFGFLIALWSTSTMTVSHLLFSLICTVYILRVLQSEERVLIFNFGEKFVGYEKWKPSQISIARKRSKV